MLNLTRTLGAFALFSQLSLAPAAIAQTVPQYDRAQLPVGAAYSWQTSEGFSKAENLEFDGEVYRFKITDLASDGSQTESMYGTNQQGRLVWFSVNEYTESYQPHDCSFLEGRCESQLFANGSPIGHSITNAYYQDGIWFHSVVTTLTDQAPVSTQVCGIHDQDSIFQALYVKYSHADSPYWMRITSGPNAARSHEMLAQVTEACQQVTPIS